MPNETLRELMDKRSYLKSSKEEIESELRTNEHELLYFLIDQKMWNCFSINEPRIKRELNH